MTGASKENLLARQQQWDGIKHRLEFSGRHTKKELKLFESFYLQQKEPAWPMGGGDPIPLIYRLWFWPEHTAEAWNQLADKVLAYPERWAEESLSASRSILLEEANSSRYNGQEGAPLGFMGGAEEAIFNFMLRVYRARGQRLVANVGSSFQYYEDLAAWLKGEVSNPYKLSRYMIELWCENLSGELVNKYKSDVILKRSVRLYLSSIAKLLALNSAEDADRWEYCNSVQDILGNRPVPELLKQWWAEVRA